MEKIQKFIDILKIKKQKQKINELKESVIYLSNSINFDEKIANIKKELTLY